ncbi:unnamed protein product [Owenia fusiformis]|uniref:Uncharacterized protein n=1 Tax=Owenia fusiformis TaxID=6347 RepID=A0A8J1TY52_OWEFU|nr:unnamed protein product [Owenia fusiformis]
MSNTFTKKYRRPKTTTLTDFGFKALPCTELPRIPSPTRRCNPHPTGLVYQNPYNRDGLTFDIWNPDYQKMETSMPSMLPHLMNVNFSSSKVPPCIHKRSHPPKVRYTENSTTRISYRKPVIIADFPHITSRFGFSPDDGPARGIVPNTLPKIKVNKNEL